MLASGAVDPAWPAKDVTGASGSADGTRRLVSRITNQRPRDIRLIVDWTALVGK